MNDNKLIRVFEDMGNVSKIKIPGLTQLQLWKYDPIFLRRSVNVDPISLIKSIDDYTDDPRMEKEYDNLIDYIKQELTSK